MEGKLLKGLGSPKLLIIGDFKAGWSCILRQNHCMHLRTPYMKKIVASFSSFYFFVLPAYCMLYVSEGV